MSKVPLPFKILFHPVAGWIMVAMVAADVVAFGRRGIAAWRKLPADPRPQ